VKIRVEDDGYPYEADTQVWDGSTIPAAMGGVVALVGQELLNLSKKLEELQKDEEGSMYRFYDVYPTGIVLAWDGMPTGIVQFLDDEPTYIPFKQGAKISEESSGQD
jgi:hypothetical protein